MEKTETFTVYYGDGEKESFFNNLDHYINLISSTVYSPQLAHILTAFSYSVYDEENARRSMESFGFSDLKSDYANELIGYTLGKKRMSDGRTLVLVCVRGSTGTTEWISNFNLAEATEVDGVNLHSGFWEAASMVYDGLTSLLDGKWDNTVFVLTGHSRGAAAANILARYLLLHDGIAQANLYVYAIACPDVAMGSDSDWNPDGIYDHIFNIANVKDIVSLIPGALGTALFAKGDDNWGKFGSSYWFVENEGDIEINPATHELSVYLNYLRNEYPLAGYKSRDELNTQRTDKVMDFRSSLARPPIDIELENEAGEEIASVIDGKVDIHAAEEEQGDILRLLRQLNPRGLDLRFSIDEGRPKLTVTSAEEKKSAETTDESEKWDIRKKARDTIAEISFRPFYGYRKDASGHPKIAEDEAEMVRTIFQAYLDGEGIKSIQRNLAEENIPSPRGLKIWPEKTLEKLLQNEKYTGNQGEEPAIISEELFQDVQACMQSRKRN